MKNIKKEKLIKKSFWILQSQAIAIKNISRLSTESKVVRDILAIALKKAK